MAWAVSNACVEPKGNAIVITNQASGTAKIDPLMAAFNAVAWMPAKAASSYEDLRTWPRPSQLALNVCCSNHGMPSIDLVPHVFEVFAFEPPKISADIFLRVSCNAGCCRASFTSALILSTMC